MTREDDFRRAINDAPADWQTRLVFADWLEEQGDHRAEGYRATVAAGVQPVYWSSSAVWGWLTQPILDKHYQNRTEAHLLAVVPDDWYAAIERHPTEGAYAAERRTATEAFDDLAAAFGKLPAARRAELLAAPPPATRARKKRRKP